MAFACVRCDRARDAASDPLAPARPVPAGDAGADTPPASEGTPTLPPANLPDAGRPAIDLGIAPNAAQLLDAGYANLGALADAEVVSLGVRAVSFSVPWKDWVLDAGANIVIDDALLSAWHDRLLSYTRAGATVVLSLDFVTRSLASFPVGVTAFDQGLATDVARALVDAVYERLGDQLSVLAFGREVDRYLAVASAAERVAFADFLHDLGDYARAHPRRPPRVRFGLWASAQGWLATPDALRELAGELDVPLASAYPFDAAFNVVPVAEALAGLVSVRDVLVTQLGYRDLVFPEIAYPSSSSVGSSEPQQAEFYQGLFQALTQFQGSVVVQIRALHDPSAEDCALESASFGRLSGPRPLWLCSLGLKHADSSPKPAFDAVRQALAVFHDE